MRESYLERKTGEVDIKVYVNLDRHRDTSTLRYHSDQYKKYVDLDPSIEMTAGLTAETGDWFGYLPHWWDQVPVHGKFDIRIMAKGDNDHHLYEDTAILLGRAIKNAVGNKMGIKRNGYGSWPFEGNIGEVSIDLSGRGMYAPEGTFYDKKLREMINHTFETFARESGIDIYANFRSVSSELDNDHHKAECIFKALARALDEAVQIHPRHGKKLLIPSSKKKLD